MKKKDEIKVCLVGSSGGHLTHLYMLKPFWKDKNRFWVTFDKEDARSLLEGEKVYPCYFPTNRSIKALIKNTKIAWDVLHIGHLFKHFNAARIAAITLPSDDRSFVDSQVALRIPISIGTSKNNRKRQEES